MAERAQACFYCAGFYVALCGMIAASCGISVAAPATAQIDDATQDTRSLVDRVLKHPADEDLWPILRQPHRREEAKQLLAAAFRDPANERKVSTRFNHPERARIDILEVYAGIYEDDAGDLLIESAKDADSDIRWWAMYLMSWRVKTPTAAVRGAIRRTLDDSDGRVVAKALDAIRAHPDAEAGPRVLQLLRHPPTVKLKSWQSITTSNSGAFSGHVKQPGFDEALGAIGATGFPGALDDLFVLANDPSASVRSRAATAIAQIVEKADPAHHAAGVQVLTNLLADVNFAVAETAAEALAEMNNPAGAAVLIVQLRRETQPPKNDWAEGGSAFSNLKLLEKLSGENLGSDKGEDFWNFDIFHDGDHKKIRAIQPVVADIILRLGKHHLASEGYPRFPTKLSDADKAMFDRAFANWLVDPRGGEWIAFHFDERTAWGSTTEITLNGWLFPAGADRAARILLEDRTELPPAQKFDRENLSSEARKTMADFVAGKEYHASAVKAAWLYRTGHEDLAAALLFLARGSGDRADFTLDHPDASGAWRAFSWAVHAYMVRADAEALTHVERLARLYPTHMDSFGPAAELLADLTRRKNEGPFNRDPDPLPADFGTWPIGKRIARLIHDLQEVDARQQGQPGGVDLSQDPRVTKLIDMGDAAVPALIDCIESDPRLTRSVHFWRDFAQSRSIITVREAALTAVMSILQTSVFEPAFTGDDFSSRGEETAKETAKKLRAYWKEYGELSYDQRMMKVLTNLHAKPDAALQAASNLAHLGDKRRIGTMVWTGGVDEQRGGPSPAIFNYNNPTVAQAVLAARDRHLQSLDPKENGGYGTRRTDDAYAEALVSLGDNRIVPELKRRFATARTNDEKRRWAAISFYLRDDASMRELADAFRLGLLKVPPIDPDVANPLSQAAGEELGAFVSCFTDAGMPYCNAALYALSEPNHPFHALAVDCLREASMSDDSVRDAIWFGHPFFVPLMRPLLDRADKVERSFTLQSVSRTWWGPGGATGVDYPDALADPADRCDSADARLCDMVGTKLSDLLVGAPAFHPLLKDRDKRLNQLRTFVDRYGSRLRRLTRGEYDSTGFKSWGGARLYVPVFLPPNQVAGSSDVAAGRAVFALAGKRSAADVVLPMSARLKNVPVSKKALGILIVQAEVGPEGKRHYGIVARHEIRAAIEDEVQDVHSLGDGAKP